MASNNEKGFTLVELAIVMIIIGLLIGGVLKGQELIENAKVTAVIAEVKSYQAALNTFKDTFGGTPGDMANAVTRLPGCAAGNTNNCVGGNGNSLVDDGNATDPVWVTQVVQNAARRLETTNFWKHLALADLITGVDPTAGTGLGNLAWGFSHPASAMRGGYEFYFDPLTTNTVSGHFLRLSNKGLIQNIGGGATGDKPVTPGQAANIDRKLDDGRPISGSVMANYGTGLGGGDGCIIGPNGAYNEQVKNKDCVMFFLIDG